MLNAVLLSVFIGFIRRGRLQNLGLLPIRHYYLFIPPFLIVAILRHAATMNPSLGRYPWAPTANIVEFIVFLVAVAVNFRVYAMPIAAAGVLTNLLAIAANDGLMPLSPRALLTAGMDELLRPDHVRHFIRHSIMTPDTHLKFFSDIIPIPGWWLIRSDIVSIGDVLVSVALFLMIQRYMCAPRLVGEGKIGS